MKEKDSMSRWIETQIKDTILQNIMYKFKQRSDAGYKKYGTNLDRTDLNTLDWINHAQEELMDGILYLEKLKQINYEK